MVCSVSVMVFLRNRIPSKGRRDLLCIQQLFYADRHMAPSPRVANGSDYRMGWPRDYITSTTAIPNRPSPYRIVLAVRSQSTRRIRRFPDSASSTGQLV